MIALILSATITLTLPTLNADSTTIPADEILIATLWNTAKTDPIDVILGYPGEIVAMNTIDNYGAWFATAWDMNGNQSQSSEIVIKRNPRKYVCGDGCHR